MIKDNWAGQELREIRKKKNLSPLDVEALTGVSPAYQSSIELGRINTTIDTMQKLLDVMGYEIKFQRKRG